MLHALLLLGLLHSSLPAGLPQAQVISLSLGLLPDAGSETASTPDAGEATPEASPATELAAPEAMVAAEPAPQDTEVAADHPGQGGVVTLHDAMGAAAADYIGQLRLYLDMTKRQPAHAEPRPKGRITYFIILDRAGSVRDYGIDALPDGPGAEQLAEAARATLATAQFKPLPDTVAPGEALVRVTGEFEY